MFDIVYLGTSASAPSVRRSLPSMVVMYNEHRFMVDCGEGTQRQLLTSGIGLKRLNKILITHSHLDHILGLAGLVSTMVRWETMEDLHIYGGSDAIERIRDLLFSVVLRGNRTPTPLFFHKLTPGVIFEEKNLEVSCFPVTHRGTDSFGYKFIEKGKRPFLAEKAAELNIPAGPWRKDLANGESITLPDGRNIDPEQVLGEYVPGTTLVTVGDTGNAMELLPYVRNADALSIESTYLEEESDMAKLYSHLTAKMAAELAKEAGVGKLYLTHVSRRYREKEILAEAQSVFVNTEVARDFSQFQIKHLERSV
ncbi:MAG: ribonuclease Z [Anaerolineaceae bacterium]|nr:ribonuclease Z [Anaerolineaceae bacterium]